MQYQRMQPVANKDLDDHIAFEIVTDAVEALTPVLYSAECFSACDAFRFEWSAETRISCALIGRSSFERAVLANFPNCSARLASVVRPDT